MAEQRKEQHNSGDPTIPTQVYVEFPKFNGSSVRTWVKKCEKYFSLFKTPNEQKVDLASLCMFRKADVWASNYLYDKQNVNWFVFVRDVSDRFRTTIGWDSEEKEFKKWEESLEEYISECELDVVKDDIAVMDKEYVQEDVKCDNLDVYLELEGKRSELLPEIPPIDIFKKGAEPVEKFLGEAEIDKEDVQDDVVIENLDECSVLNGSLLVAFAMDGQVKPLPWRDKIEVYNLDSVGLGLLGSDFYGSFIAYEWDANCNTVLGDMNGKLDCLFLGNDQKISNIQLSFKEYGEMVSDLDASSDSSRNGSVYAIGWNIRPCPWRDKNSRGVISEVVPSEGFIRSKNIEKLWSELSNGRELTYKVIQSEDSVDMVVFGGMTIPEASDQFYQVHQFSGLKISEQCGNFDNTFENSWKMRPLPWRDKFVKSCLMNYMSVNWISAWGLGIYGPALLCSFIGSFGYLSVTKWKGIRMDKSFKAELVTDPIFFNYEGLTTATESRTEFFAEMSMRACLRHKNFVQFQGWCVGTGELFLVYEFMPMRALIMCCIKHLTKGQVQADAEMVPVAILDKRIVKVQNKAQVQYLVQWEGVVDASWEVAENFVERNLHGMLALCVTEDADKWPTAAALLRFFQICDAFQHL